MAKKPITAADIAKIAGVSRSTVAGVVNDYGYIADSTKKRVRAIIDEYGYVPNSAARGLVGKKPKIFGHFIFGDKEKIKNAYFGELIVHIIEAAQNAGYSVVTSTIRSSESDTIRNLLQNGTIRGAVISGGSPSREKVENLLGLKFPIVFVDKLPRDFDLSGTEEKYIISPDNYAGAEMAVRYLITRGHRDIIHISGLPHRVASAKREKAFLDVLSEYGISDGESRILQGDFSSETSDRLFTEYLETRDRTPTAVFAANDMTAVGVMRACRRKGLSIPDDISLIGYDNLSISGDLQPSLTTVDPGYDALAAAAVKVMTCAVEGEACTPAGAEAPSLIERESVRTLTRNS